MNEIPTNEPAAGTDFRPPEFDPSRYAGHLEDLDMTEEEAHRFLLTLWQICQSLVDLGFGLTPDPDNFLPKANFRARTDSVGVGSVNTIHDNKKASGGAEPEGGTPC
ncbi:MAG: hypothetical protein V2I43_06810 [Parvularcula sp.]|jgi:hypothetical protein|nr:hypothetical protein [Parvularcula sp.]